MGPLIPYVTIAPLHLLGPLHVDAAGLKFDIGELSIKPFGTLVAIGVYIGTELARRQGQRLKVDAHVLSSFVLYILVGGFVGGHVLDSIFYHPDVVLSSPASLLRIWDGQSSFGGFTGSFCGLVAWRLKFKRSALLYADVVASAFPAAWVFGRMGCGFAHDHPGRLSNAWYAVAYPGGGRFDLGLYECLLTIPLALAFLRLTRRPRRTGFFLGTLCIAYAPVRFLLDFLRAVDVHGADPRYAGLTPAQWGCLLLLSAGLYVTYRARQFPDPSDPSVAPPPEADAGTGAAAPPAASTSASASASESAP